MNELKAVIFDVDGTLAETERDGHLVAINKAFETLGLQWQWSSGLYAKLLKVTGSAERLAYFVENWQPEYQHINTDLSQLIDNIVRLKKQYYAQIVKRGEIPLRPGVKSVLHELRTRKIRLAIATTASPENVHALLANTLGEGSLAWFEVIAAGDCVARKKPASDVYRYVLDKLALPAQACLVFEDTENGIDAATGAGIAVVGLISEYSTQQELAQANVIIDSWGTPEKPMGILAGKLNGRFDRVSRDFMVEVLAGITA